MPLTGYARVSKEDQDLALQLDMLRAAGCAEVFKEHASEASRTRPQLAAAVARVRWGDTLVVARIDRPAEANALVAGRPAMTLAQLGAELVRLRHLPPGG